MKKKKQLAGNVHLYEVNFSNKGGLVMPIIIEWTYVDSTIEIERIPAQIWRKNENKVVKTFLKNKEVIGVRLDPFRETADIELSNNQWPTTATKLSKFSFLKARKNASRGDASGKVNPMQKEIKE
jgi:hypothetical protein